MLITLANEPRAYPWGSSTLIAELQGRVASGAPEAEVWFGDHPGCPARVPDSRPLGQWLATDAVGTGAPERLPFLVKLLAAGSPLSIQAHPSIAQAREGFAREEAAGIPQDAPERTYRDDNHKPELIVALSPQFTALAGLRDADASARLLRELGEGGAKVAERLAGADQEATLREVIGWLLSGDAAGEVAAIHGEIVAGDLASGSEFAAERENARYLAEQYPGDPGVVVALLMNLLTLRQGEGVFVAAGILHAYVAGLGIEVMSASDNVLRGGLTSKHLDVAELVTVLDTRPSAAAVVPSDSHGGVTRFEVPVADFALACVDVDGAADVDGSVAVPNSGQADGEKASDSVAVPCDGVTIALATVGEILLRGGASKETVLLAPGTAAVITPDEGEIQVSGRGRVYLAGPGGVLAADQ